MAIYRYNIELPLNLSMRLPQKSYIEYCNDKLKDWANFNSNQTKGIGRNWKKLESFVRMLYLCHNGCKTLNIK